MKNKIFKVMAVVMAAIFVFGSISAYAITSPVKVNKDYRNMDILNKQNVKVNKPTAQFAAKRIVNGEVADMTISYADYDLNTDYPTLVCYVGDTLAFTDMSKSNNGGSLIEWDWQFTGSLGTHTNVYRRNIVNESVFHLDEPGETIFYLCVRNDAEVKVGCCDPWSENGNHQVVGKNRWFPSGAYWYFTAIRVIVKPIREAVVNVRYWDAPNNRIFHEGYVNIGTIYNDSDMLNTTYHITDWEGYNYLGWNVQLPDGTIQYSGDVRDVDIEFSGTHYEKYLNIEYVPVVDKRVTVNYIDSKTEKIIKSDVKTPDESSGNVIKVEFDNVPGYEIDEWILKTPDDTIEAEGKDDPVTVALSNDNPHKILEVYCKVISSGNSGKEPSEEKPGEPEVVVKPSGICDGVITWKETDYHRVFAGYSKTGRKLYDNCNHTFTYKAVLTAEADISPTVLKSGYGFEIDVECDIETSMIDNDGCGDWGDSRDYTAILKNPTTATVFVPWDMTNRLGSQGRSISMDGDGTLKFTLPESPVSEIGARKIYTPVELAGTEEAPQTHSFEIYIGGGGVDSVEFCQKLDGSITINGDMYSDDFSGAD